jgi:tetratricopeptide (TPR) repeat protein
LECFSKAIEADPTEPTFYTNSIDKSVVIYLLSYIGAAVYIALDKFDESIRDCDKAIEINP